MPVDITPGSRGEFSVWVNAARVAQKDKDGFPSDADVLAAVRRQLPGETAG